MERLAAMTVWNLDESVRYFQRRLRGMGVTQALREAGVLIGDKRGRKMVYRVDVQYLEQTLRGLADALEECCGSQTNCCEITESDQDPAGPKESAR